MMSRRCFESDRCWRTRPPTLFPFIRCERASLEGALHFSFFLPSSHDHTKLTISRRLNDTFVQSISLRCEAWSRMALGDGRSTDRSAPQTRAVCGHRGAEPSVRGSDPRSRHQKQEQYEDVQQIRCLRLLVVRFCSPRSFPGGIRPPLFEFDSFSSSVFIHFTPRLPWISTAARANASWIGRTYAVPLELELHDPAACGWLQMHVAHARLRGCHQTWTTHVCVLKSECRIYRDRAERESNSTSRAGSEASKAEAEKKRDGRKRRKRRRATG